MARKDSTETTAGETPKVSRPRKSPAEKAQQAYEKADRDLNRAADRLAKLQGQVAEAQAEVDRANRQLDYVSRNPDLPAETEPQDVPEIEGTSAAE